MGALVDYLARTLAPSTVASSPRIWGDGFVCDDFASLARAGRCDDISDDELVRVFPRLVECSAMSERLQGRLGRWLDAMPPLGCGSREDGASIPEEIEGLRQLHRNMLQGIRADYDTELAESFAFHVCAHPVYLWPAALLSHQFYSTIAWLGLLKSGRPCLMPGDVAEYICENVERVGARFTAHPSLERRAGSLRTLSGLLSHAEHRLGGRRTILSVAILAHGEPAQSQAGYR